MNKDKYKNIVKYVINKEKWYFLIKNWLKGKLYKLLII